MKRFALFAASFAFAWSATGITGPVGTASAQSAGTSGPVALGDLFVPDGVDFKPGAKDKLLEAAPRLINRPGECPQEATFKVTTNRRKPDPVLQEALALARRDVIKAYFDSVGYLPPMIHVEGELGNRDDVQVDYRRRRDRERPKLDTRSDPRKGSKVEPGSTIKVTMVARDDRTAWQTGIQSIQLVAQLPGGDVRVGGQDYPPVVRPNCEGRPEPRTLELTYQVPQNPPPIIRLVAIAEDFANLSDLDRAEFPTGDWYGTLTYSYTPQPTAWALQASGRLDVSLKYDGRGNLTGTMVGTQEQVIEIPDGPLAPRCSKSVTPGTFKAKLLGQHTPSADAMSIQAVEPEFNPGEVTPCPPAGPLVQPSPDANPLFQQVLRGLRPVGNGVFQSEVEQSYSGQGPTALTVKYSLTLRRAAN